MGNAIGTTVEGTIWETNKGVSGRSTSIIYAY